MGNDTGGALTQIAAVSRPERIGAIVLTSCDAFDNFPPRLFRIALAPARVPGRDPGGLRCAAGAALRRLPIAYGWLTNEPIDADAEDSYVLPVLTRGEIRRDVRGLLGGLDPDYTRDAAAKLTSWDKPALIAWSARRPLLPARARRATGAGSSPGARLEWIEDARTFSPEDRPERLAELILDFARAPARAASRAW